MRQTRAAVDRLAALVAALGPGPWLVTDVLEHGWTQSSIRAAVAAGRLVRPYRQVLMTPQAAADGLERARAAVLATPGTAVVSHESAGTIQGLWLPRQAPAGVQLTVPGGVVRQSSGKRLHGGLLPAEHVTHVQGLPVTTVARTAVDLARGTDLGGALLALDSGARALVAATGVDLRALRRPDRREALAPPAAGLLGQVADVLAGHAGTSVLGRALALVDPASESPHESRCRAWIHEAGLPAPLVGWRVVGASGALYYGDLVWEGERLICEVDGFAKYGTTAAEVSRSTRAERARQADVEDAGWRVVRVSTADTRAATVARVARALGVAPRTSNRR